MLIENAFLATGTHFSCSLYEWFSTCKEPWRERVSLNYALLFLHFATDFFIVLECPTSCQASCKTSKNTESMQVCIASVWDRNVVGMHNWSRAVLHSAFVLLVVLQLVCLVLLYIKVMLLERKAFSVHELDTFLPYCFSGCVFFLCLGIFYMFRPNMSFVAPVQEKVVVGLFFLGAILCLSFSWLFHTVYCHSEGVSRLFSK